MIHLELTPDQINEILTYLNQQPAKPSIIHLNQLIAAYIERVPWESVSRITKYRSTAEQEKRPRWPAEFWNDAILTGSGGTCFETNYAFFSLLYALGYTGYMTINDMGETRACHAAIMIFLCGRKYLVDVSIPLEKAIPLNPAGRARRETNLQTVTVISVAERTYQVVRSPHPRPYVFTLIDAPIRLPEYEYAVINDYGQGGYFLDRLVIVKKVNQRVWRFNGAEKPYKLEAFGKAGKLEIELSPDTLVQTLSQRFNLAEDFIKAALIHTNPDVIERETPVTAALSGASLGQHRWLRFMA